MRQVMWALGICGVMALGNAAANLTAGETRTTESALARVARPGPLVIAHRGDSKAAPENTLPAFASAVKVGADLVELDYYHSADGVPVVFHDGTLDRTTDATKLWGGSKLRITEKKLAELKLLDSGTWFDPRFAGTRIPTLAEALDTIQAGSMTLVERKGGDPVTCVALLKEKNLLDSVVVQAFDWKYLQGCHEAAPNLVLAALGDKELTPARLEAITKTGAKIVAWDDKSTTPETIAAIHDRGWKAWVWTVDDPARMRELAAAKIDGIITNRPGLAREAVGSAPAKR